MAKLRREKVGQVMKSKDNSKPDYIKFERDVAIKAGDIVRLETKKFQLESLQSAVAAGKLSGEQAEKAKERIERIPDFVRGELIVLREV